MGNRETDLRQLLPDDEVRRAVGELLHEVPRLDPRHPRAVGRVYGHDLVADPQHFGLVSGTTYKKINLRKNALGNREKDVGLTGEDFLDCQGPIPERRVLASFETETETGTLLLQDNSQRRPPGHVHKLQI